MLEAAVSLREAVIASAARTAIDKAVKAQVQALHDDQKIMIKSQIQCGFNFELLPFLCGQWFADPNP